MSNKSELSIKLHGNVLKSCPLNLLSQCGYLQTIFAMAKSQLTGNVYLSNESA